MDIIDEIESYLSTYRIKAPLKLTKYTEDLQAADEPARFNKTWCKLALSEKLNRLMHYLAKVTVKLNLTSLQSEDLRKFFYEHVNNTLASDECVSYDPTDGEIITIVGLKYEDNKFYIQTQCEPRPEGVRVKQRIFSNIDEFVNSTKTCGASADAAQVELKQARASASASASARPRADSDKILYKEVPKELVVFMSPQYEKPTPPKKVVIIKKKMNTDN
jgi:hypothetical protein